MALIAVDTNVVVRLFTRDDPEQFERAEACFAGADVFVPDSVLLETAWVLESVYSFDDRRIAAALRKLLGMPNVRSSEADTLALALNWYEQGFDFADALHLAKSQQADEFRTFDRTLLKVAAGVGQCRVLEPPARG